MEDCLPGRQLPKAWCGTGPEVGTSTRRTAEQKEDRCSTILMRVICIIPTGCGGGEAMLLLVHLGTGRITLRALGAAQMDMPSMPDMLRKVVCGGHHSSSRSRSMHRSVIQTRGGAETETEVATKTRATTDETVLHLHLPQEIVHGTATPARHLRLLVLQQRWLPTQPRK